MNLALFIKFIRLLLAVSVSLWMAGGCLFGCSNTNVMAAEVAPSSDTAAGGESCHKSRAHDCCTRPVAQKQKPKAVTSFHTPKDAPAATPEGVLTAPPHGMKDCPLLANNNAVTAKSSVSETDPGRTPVSVVPSIQSLNELPPVAIGSSYVPNRGPTHLRCCVFLI